MESASVGARTLTRNLGFSLVAISTLALGVGANTAIFSVVKAVLVNPLPYAEAERLVKIAEPDPDTPRPETVDFTITYDWRVRSRSFQSLSLYRDGSAARHRLRGFARAHATAFEPAVRSTAHGLGDVILGGGGTVRSRTGSNVAPLVASFPVDPMEALRYE